VSQILLVPPCRCTASDVLSNIHPRIIVTRPFHASLFLLLWVSVDKVILFQSRSRLIQLRNHPRRPLVSSDWTLISQYLCTCSILRHCRATSIASTSAHPPVISSALYTTHNSFAPGVAPAAHLKGHRTITFRPATPLIPPKHRETLVETWGTISTLIFHIFAPSHRFSRFLGLQLGDALHCIRHLYLWYPLSVPYSVFTLPHSAPFFTQHPTQIVLRNVCTIEKDSGVVVFFRTSTISWGYLV
jgi:hypothetical protein